MSVKRVETPPTPALARRRIIVMISANFLAAFANVELAGPLRLERLPDGTEVIALPAFVTAPAGAFPAEGERVDVAINFIEGRAIYVTGLQRRGAGADGRRLPVMDT